MSRRPSERIWRLTVRDGSLALIAPHGTFIVRGLEPAVAREVATFPEGIEVECDGDYEGGANIDFLVVTRIRHVLAELVPLTRGVPDREVHAHSALARARAAERLGVGDADGAAADLVYALRGDAFGVHAVYAALPAAQRATLADDYAAWARTRDARWEILRWIPPSRWSDAQLEAALTHALASGGRFGEIRAEELVDELAGRGRDLAQPQKKLAKLRRAQASEGGTFFRIDPPFAEPRVVGATRDTVHVTGILDAGPPAVTPPDGRRHLVEARVHAMIAYDTEGHARARYLGLAADLVVDGVVVQLHSRSAVRTPPHARRLADDAVLCTFTSEVIASDHLLVCTRDEIRHVATGELVATLPPGVHAVWWDDERIHVHGAQPCVLSRATGKLLPEVPREPASQITMPDGSVRTLRPHDQVRDWIYFVYLQQLVIGPLDGELVELRLRRGYRVALAPPWLVLAYRTEPLLLIALAEVVTCRELRVDGTLVAKRVVR